MLKNVEKIKEEKKNCPYYKIIEVFKNTPEYHKEYDEKYTSITNRISLLSNFIAKTNEENKFDKAEINNNEIKDKNLDKNENIEVYFDNFDIILKTISLKVYNNFNPALAKALCDFFESLYNVIAEHQYFMTDIEIYILFSLLMEKLSINN